MKIKVDKEEYERLLEKVDNDGQADKDLDLLFGGEE